MKKIKKKYFTAVLILFMLSSCMDIFTSNLFSEMATDVSDMTPSQISAYLETTPLSDISDEDLIIIENQLIESRIELTEDSSDEDKALYVSQSSQLLEINISQADVLGLISEVSNIGSDDDVIDSILNDTDRLDDITEASDYALDIYEVDPDSLTSTELVVGSVGLISEILKDDTALSNLENVEDYDTDTLEAAGFSEDEISKIQTANEMLNLAESKMGEDSPLSDLFEGLPV